MPHLARNAGGSMGYGVEVCQCVPGGALRAGSGPALAMIGGPGRRLRKEAPRWSPMVTLAGGMGGTRPRSKIETVSDFHAKSAVPLSGPLRAPYAIAGAFRRIGTTLAASPSLSASR